GQAEAMRFIDLSHTIEHGMVTYKGLPAPIICDYLSREASRSHYAEGTTFQIGRIEMVANTGTYIDSPFHRFADGIDLAGLPLDRLADLDGIVIRATDHGGREARGIGVDRFEGLDLRDKAVLVYTGWDAHWRTPQYAQDAPFVTRLAAEFLVGAAPSLVGIDSVNLDDKNDGTRPAHTLLLEAGIPVVEHLCNLAELPVRGFRFHC